MSKEVIIRCDNPSCGKTQAKETWFKVGRSCDAAGDMDDKFLAADLCDGCRFKILEELVVSFVSEEKIKSFLTKLKYFRET